MLAIDFDIVPGWNNFLVLYEQCQQFTDAEENFDPRKSCHILDEFKLLVSPQDYNSVVRDFKSQVKLLLKEVLN